MLDLTSGELWELTPIPKPPCVAGLMPLGTSQLKASPTSTLHTPYLFISLPSLCNGLELTLEFIVFRSLVVYKVIFRWQQTNILIVSMHCLLYDRL